MNRYLFLFTFCISIYIQSDLNNALIETYKTSTNKDLINIVIKDNIDIKGKVTSAGSLALSKNIAKKNAFIIEKLINANYQIYGKANLSEWANFRSINSVSGWSSINGQTSHPVNNKYNPCGSSSGSAVAVATGIVDIAIGTETNGSISCPASIVGIVGMKPTLGLVSRSGIIPIADSQDTAGPMGNSVEIVAKTLQVISGQDPMDIKTQLIPNNFDFNFAENIKQKNLNGIRFGLLNSGFDNKYGKRFLNQLIDDVSKLGGEIIFIEDNREYPSEEEYLVLLYEFKYGLESYLTQSTEPKKTLKKIIDFNNENSEKIMPFFGQEIFYASLEAAEKHNEYVSAKNVLKKVTNQTIALMDEYKIDAFIGLTRGPAWKIDYEGGDGAAIADGLSFGNGGYAAFGGLPHITIPYFKIDNFPVGISIIGRPWSDKEIIAFAAALEK
jgi:Asp-tRNA(Asn)/Glu-tRNA(Gln) amidotransferase A subunit family amidase